ncbi:hypothetical protein [Aneurinibacillus migulanus]|uniref:hypothetical protein n=1 Tax=Aneurinibacillus migulanus TaxID=47500 RepID=UPI000A8723EA|nr:hypothetical protein [Aneurinibacillus migulanus]
MVGGKKRRKGGGWERSEKDTSAFLLLEHRANFFFFPNLLLPTTLPCQNIIRVVPPKKDVLDLFFNELKKQIFTARK